MNPTIRTTEFGDDPDYLITWAEDGYRLDLWDTNRTSHYGKTILRYRFSDEGYGVVFEGEDFAVSPLHAIDSPEAAASLLGFLSLRPGDTDADYFESYTPEQTAWCDARAEYLSLLVSEIENPA